MPAYQQVKEQLNQPTCVTTIQILDEQVNILETVLPETSIPLWLVDCPALFDRPGNPYIDEQGKPWHDNAQRFALFCRTIVSIALDNAQLDWSPDILHCNDWHTGLACALLDSENNRPKTIFTIHNLAYQGLFSHETFLDLNLPEQLWSYESIEYNGQLSFIKAGIVYADHVTTVSPTYATEIQTSQYGAGLEDLLTYYSSKLSGIINGINKEEWNPATDNKILNNYTENNIENKLNNKLSLQKEFGLLMNSEAPLYSVVSRIAEQKGIDLIISILHEVISQNAQLIVLGAGEKELEEALISAANKYPANIAVKIGYDETLAHKITASADFFLMPSRYEPCGLNQMYSQRYGTIPIVRKTGGLADTVINYTNEKNNTQSTGIIFEEDSSVGLLNAFKRSLILFKDKAIFRKIRLSGMQQDFSWQKSALEYTKTYLKNKT